MHFISYCALFYLIFRNFYKIFILYMAKILANFLSFTLSYIFQFPKPYIAFYKIKSVVFFNEWGSHNNQIVILISFACSFYKTLVSNKICEKIKDKKEESK